MKQLTHLGRSLLNSPVVIRVVSVAVPVVGLIWLGSKLLGVLEDAGLPTG